MSHSKYTNNGLVAYCRKLLSVNTKYMWGGLARIITPAYIAQLAKLYPRQYTAQRIAELKQCCGKGVYGVDCVGVPKTYVMDGLLAKKYTADKDLNAGALYRVATEKGRIETMPERPGLCLYCKSKPHIGVYLGNGRVAESTLSERGDGVVETALSDFSWEFWFQNPFIEADNTEPVKAENERTIETGQKISCSGAKLYVGAYTKNYVRILRGDYYVYDGKIINGRVRICPLQGQVGKPPLVENVTGYVEVKEL